MTPEYDAAGNLTLGPRPDSVRFADSTRDGSVQRLVYDAWNRLVAVHEDDGAGGAGAIVEKFEYDGRSFRVARTSGGVLEVYYHNEDQQLLEVRTDTNGDGVIAGAELKPTEWFIWDISYIDTPLTRIQDRDGNGSGDRITNFLYDAGRNVTAAINGAGRVHHRYVYDAFGAVSVRDRFWNAAPRSLVADPGGAAGLIGPQAWLSRFGFTGRQLDPASNLLYFRARHFDASLGRFTQRDPLGFVDGMSLYRGYFVPGGVDPSGMDWWDYLMGREGLLPGKNSYNDVNRFLERHC